MGYYSAMDANTTIPNATSDGDSAKKYIRTLAGDMKIVEEGGTPDLKPLTPPTVPIPVTIQDSEPVPTPEPLKSMPLNLKTYAGDFSDRMKETNAVTATVLAAEQDSAPQSLQVEDEPQSSKNLIYSIAGVVLVIAGLGGAYFAYTQYYTATSLPVLTGSAQAPILVDERQEISGTGTALLQAIEQSISRPLAIHMVRFLFMASSTESIFSMLPLSAPDILWRNVNAVGSMTGVVSTGGGNSPFFILSVSTYRDTFAGMLSWERTMPNNLAELFPPYPSPVAPVIATTTATATTTSVKVATTTAPGITSTTSTSSGQETAPGFRDEVVSNHDVRVYRDALGRSVVIYGYWNQTTVVIARDPSAFAELIGRLATSHTQP